MRADLPEKISSNTTRVEWHKSHFGELKVLRQKIIMTLLWLRLRKV